MVVAAQLVAKVSAEGTEASAAKLSAFDARVKEARASTVDFTKGAMLLGAAAVIGIGVAAVKMGGDFQAGMTSLVTGAGESAKNIKMVSDGILKMAVDTGTSTQQLTAGMFMVDSAGYTAANGGLSVLRTAAEGARVGNADLATTSMAMISVMKDYHFQASQSSDAMNFLTAIVQNGTTTMQDLAASIHNVLPTASALGVNLKDVGAAMATMTGETVPAADAATYLRQMLMSLAAPSSASAKSLKEIGLTVQDVSDGMKKNLPDTLKMIMTHLAETYKVGSPEYVAALKNIAGGAKQMQGFLDLTGSHLADFQANLKNVSGVMNQGAGQVAGWTAVQGDFNFALDQAKEAVEVFMIKLGTGLLPLLTPLVSNVAKAVGAFADWASSGHAVSDLLSLTGKYAQIALPILAAIGAMVLAVLVPAFLTWAAAVIAATWPILLIGAAVAGLVAIFVHFYQTNAGFKSFIDGIAHSFGQAAQFVQANFVPAMQAVGGFLQKNVLPILSQIGAFLLATFMPVWQQLVALWNSQLMPLFKQLWAAIQPLAPVLQFLGTIIGGIVIVSLGLLVGFLAGAVKGFAGLLSGIVTIIGGIVQVFTGVVQVVSGIVRFIYDLFTGNFGKLSGDLGTIWQGIINIFGGAWKVIQGIFQAAWGFISGLVSGFVQGIIGFFTHLWDALVGHSIIPDMINGIVSWFGQLPGRVGAFVLSMVSTVLGKLGGLLASGLSWAGNFVGGIFAALGQLAGRAGSAIQQAIQTILSMLAGALGAAAQAGANIVQSIASGIINSIGSAIGNAMNAVGSFIQDHLPHSPAKRGPLRELAYQGSQIPEQIAQGMVAGMPKLQAGLNLMLMPPPAKSSFGAGGPSYSFPSMRASGPTQIVVQPTPIYLDGRLLTNGLMPHVVSAIRAGTGVVGM